MPKSGFHRSGRMARHRLGGRAGIALIQVIVAMGLVAICGAVGIRGLMEMNRKAAATRIFNNARAVVQRNIDTAMGVQFSSSGNPPVPAILAIGSANYDDDGGGDNLVNIIVPRTGTGAVIKGTLLRTVTAESNTALADIRRITFKITYNYRGKPYEYSMSTIRTTD